MHKGFVERVAENLGNDATVTEEYDSSGHNWKIVISELNIGLEDHDLLITRERIIRLWCTQLDLQIFMQDNPEAVAAVIRSWIGKKNAKMSELREPSR